MGTSILPTGWENASKQFDAALQEGNSILKITKYQKSKNSVDKVEELEP